jgi:hypothetical protein
VGEETPQPGGAGQGRTRLRLVAKRRTCHEMICFRRAM